jgi:argininosuccinate lyase
MVALNLSLDVDRRLWRQDLRGSRAWARALVAAGVLDREEGERLVRGLDRVEERLGSGLLEGEAPPRVPDEDIHSLVERLLTEEVGPVAGKLHTGRSRNDQVATDVRLWGMEATHALEAEITGLARSLLRWARRSVDVILPGYTHLQQAQPVRAAHWILSHLWPLLRDRDRIRRARAGASVLPLGSGALAGCPFPVDRDALARELGFDRVSANSMDAVSDRDWMADLLHAGALLGVHLSRLSEDLVVFSSVELGFVRLSDGYSTGSSLMPQKRNPDVAELVRGKTGRLVGNLTGLLTLLKGLPSGYNRDLQEDKVPLFDTVDTLTLLLPALAGAVQTAELRPDRIREALDPQLLATDVADHLVRQGVPFRESHEVVGRLVRMAEERGCALDELPDEAFGEAHPDLPGTVRSVFDWGRSVDARATAGGTARSAVEAQLEAADAALGSSPPAASPGPGTGASSTDPA